NLNKQKQLAEMKSEFISNMTHELKTPIATMGVALEALSDFGGMNDPKRKAEYLDISKHELNRLEILVDKVMQMSSIENNELKIEMESLDLKSLSEKMIKSMRLQFENAQVQLTQNIEGNNFNVKGDKMHLTNVLYNLLDNALKYSKENPTIHFKLKEEPKHIVFEIEDNGIGIKPEYQKKIFDRFFRVPTNDIHNVKGHGIGLNYVADIIEKHHGEIKLKSEENKGTCITISLPKL
ncbi:MAG: HAMP domain-containing sensor histidine kinase, partial [Bacteroidota bacterium]